METHEILERVRQGTLSVAGDGRLRRFPAERIPLWNTE